MRYNYVNKNNKFDNRKLNKIIWFSETFSNNKNSMNSIVKYMYEK